MKAGWELKSLEQIATTFGRGKSKHRPRNDAILYGGEYPFIQTGDVRNADHFISEFSQTYSEVGLAQSKLWPKGTICITIAANIAETGILGFDACFPDSVIGVVPNPAEAEVGYVEYLLQSFKVRIQALGQGSAQANINMGTFEGERFPFPCVVEQKRIVTLLDEAFDGIATARAHAEQNLQNARAIFESHLQSVFTQRGDGWVQTSLGSETDLLVGFAFKSESYSNADNDVRLLRGDNIIQGSLRWDDVKRWPANDVETYERYRLRDGDIVLAMDRPWVKAGLKHATISVADLPCLLVQRTACLRNRENLDSRFLMHLIGSAAFTNHILGVQTGSGVPHISGQQIKDFEFSRPSVAAQRSIADRLDSLSAETQRLESLYQRKLTALDELKKSLLAQAFSGAL